MGAAGIELPDFVTPEFIEDVYRRCSAMRARGEDHPKARDYLVRGMNMARARAPKMLLFLEKGATHLRRMNDAQQSRFEANETGVTYHRTDFNEYAQWKSAYILALEPREGTMYRTFGWIYASVAEALVEGPGRARG